MKVLLICYLGRNLSDGYHDKYIADSFETWFLNKSRNKGSYWGWGAKHGIEEILSLELGGGKGGARDISRW